MVTNPERFAPLHTVAEALIEHLSRDYDVTVQDDASAAADLVRRHDPISSDGPCA